MKEEKYAEYQPPPPAKPIETPEGFEAVDIDHYAMAANFYRDIQDSDIEMDDTTPFGKSNLKYVSAFVVALGAMHFWSKNLMQFSLVDPFQILFMRGLISSVLSIMYLRGENKSLTNIESPKVSLVVFGAFIGFLSLSGLYISLYTLSITDAFALDCLSVLVTTFIDYVIFHGNLRFSHFVGYACALMGVLFLVRPSYLFEETNDIEEKNNFVYGFVAGLISALLAGAYSGILRRTFVKVDAFVSLTYRQVATAILSPIAIFIFSAITGRPWVNSLWVWFSMLGIGVLGWVSSYYFCQALKQEKLIARVYPFKFVLIAFGIVADLTYFKCELIPSTYIGLCLIGVNFVFAAYQLFYISA